MYADDLLWGYLEDRITLIDFQEFANEYYECLLAYNVKNIDVSKEFAKQLLEY